MKNSKKKLFALSLAAIGITTGAVLISSSGLTNLGLSAISSQSVVENQTVTFSRSTGDVKKISDTKYSISGTLANGSKIYLISDSISGLASGAVVTFSGNSNDVSYIADDEDGLAPMSFQALSSIGFKGTEFGKTMKVYTSVDGSHYEQDADASASLSNVTYSFTNRTKFFKLKSDQAYSLSTFKITYSCSTSGSYKVLDSVEITKEPSITEFNVNDEFNYNGMELTAHYEDGTSYKVSPTSVSTPDMSTSGTKTVTVTFEDEGIQKSDSYEITVNESTGIQQSYSYEGGNALGYYNAVITFENFDTAPNKKGTGTYYCKKTKDSIEYEGTMRFTWKTTAENNFSFTYVSSAGDTTNAFGSNYWMFVVGKSETNDATIKGNNLAISLYYKSDGKHTGEYTFTPVA